VELHQTPRPEAGNPTSDATRLADRPGVRDALFGLLFMFPAAAVVALVYRFPVPFGGFVSGPAGVWSAMLATLFYGLAGGFVVVPVIAALAGRALRRMGFGRTGQALAPVLAALLYAAAVAASGMLAGPD
jgi:hypothetical protein